MVKPIYSDLLKEFGVPKTTLCKTLNVLLPTLKCSYLNYLWDLIEVVKLTSQRVIEVIRLTKINKIGRSTYLLRDKEAYIVVTE